MNENLTFRNILIGTFSLLCASVSAEIIECQIGDFEFKADTETKTAKVAHYYGMFSESVSIPENITYDNETYRVTSLGEQCFSYNYSLSSVDIPSSITRLEEYCFSSCRGLKSIQIPSSVTFLGDGCFDKCSSLSSINIPKSVTSVGILCFSRCESLNTITVDNDNPVFDSRDNCNAIIETQSNTMIAGCKNTVIPSSVTSLGDDCFENCNYLYSIDIPASVKSLGEWCFFGCEHLESIIIPSSVTSVGSGCFGACNALTSIKVDDNNTVYDSRDNCNAIIETQSNTMIAAIKSTKIPNTVTGIGDLCYYVCDLSTIDIPSSVTRIGEECFVECSYLKTVVCRIPTAIEGDFFWFTPIDKATLYVPEQSLASYQTTSPWNGFGKILPITSTGIENTTTGNSTLHDAVFDISGKRLCGMQHGLNIIRMSDGTTRKIIK